MPDDLHSMTASGELTAGCCALEEGHEGRVRVRVPGVRRLDELLGVRRAVR